MANQAFTQHQYTQCTPLLLVTIQSAIESGNWSEAVRALILFGRCQQAMGEYEKAGATLKKARTLVSAIADPAVEKALTLELDARIEQSEDDERSYKLWQSLRQKCEALIADGEFEKAESLCFRELNRSRSVVSRQNWFAAAITRLMLGSRLSSISAMLADSENCKDRVSARLEACRELLESSSEIACDQVNEHRASWLADYCSKLEQHFQEMQAKVESILEKEEEETARREKLLATMERNDYEGEDGDGLTPLSWQHPFAPDLMLSFKGSRVERILQDAHELFIRAEWSQCLERVQDLLEEANQIGHLPLAVVAWTLSARCLAHQGNYGEAADSLGWATSAATSVPAPAGVLMVRGLHALSETLVENCRRYDAAAALTSDWELFCASDKPSHAAGVIEEAVDEWSYDLVLLAVALSLKARHLIVQDSAAGENDGVRFTDATSTAESARGYLREVDRLLYSNGGDLHHWIYPMVVWPARDELFDFCDRHAI